jgi:LysM repeat protein
MRTSFFICSVFTLAGILSNSFCYAQNTTLQDITDYIQTYKAAAIEEMQRAKIPASITLAQGLHESGNGKSVLAREAKNHFGIKCHKEWNGKTYTYDDDAKGECFRVYDDAFTSYRDHSDFLTSRTRYADLFTYPINDYKSWAYGLKAAGYATNPKYAEIIIRTIEENKLYEYDVVIAPDKSINNNVAQAVVTPAVKETAPERQSPTTINQVLVARLNADATVAQVASLYSLEASDIAKFNDVATTDVFPKGTAIFLEHKRKTGEVPSYTVKKGESMKSISDQFGVRLNTLYARNLMKENDQPIEGETIYLQGKRTVAPSTVSYAEFIKQHAPKAVILPNPVKPAPALVSTTTTNGTVDKTTEAMVVKQDDKIYIPITSKVQVEQPVVVAKQPAAVVPVQAAKTIAAPTVKASAGVSTYVIQPKDTLYSLSRKFNVSVEEIKAWNNMTDNSISIGQSLIVSK